MGFLESKGNLDVLHKEVFNLEFSIFLKRDKVLLNLIKRLLHIPNKVIIEQERWNQDALLSSEGPAGWLIKTQNSRAISNIINIYSSKNCKFKGMKALSFKLWRRAFIRKDNIKKISKIQQILHRIEKKLRYNKG